MKALILSLCDHSGAWSQPYVDAGYEVIRIDLQEGQDVRLMKRIDMPVHGILMAPPCTVFCKASAWMWASMEESKIIEGLSIVDACLRTVAIYRPAWWALENPSGRLRQYLGAPKFRFQPNQFGDPWKKHTCLWGHFTPPTPMFCKAMVTVAATMGDVTTSKFSSSNKNGRSKTPAGFAQAFFEANP